MSSASAEAQRTSRLCAGDLRAQGRSAILPLERDQVAYGEEPKVTIPFNTLAEAKLILTDDLIRDALRADKLAKAQAANQNDEDDSEE